MQHIMNEIIMKHFVYSKCIGNICVCDKNIPPYYVNT